MCNKLKTKISSGKIGDFIFSVFIKFISLITLFVLSGIIISLVFSSWPSINKFGFSFLWSKEWNVQTQKFGALIGIYGTLVTSIIALIIAVPISFGIALFLTELSPIWLKKPLSIAIELLAAIPSIVYGMWGLFVFAPIFSNYFQKPLKNFFSKFPIVGNLFSGPTLGIGILTAGIILSIMIIPYVASVIRHVFEQNLIMLKESAYAIGCTTWEVIWHVILPYSRSGIVGAVILGLSRSLGETMAMTFVIGNVYQLNNFSLFMLGNTITSILANEFSEAEGELHVSALMELGLILFIITFVALVISKLMISSLDKNKRY